jgi:hypothetical protein
MRNSECRVWNFLLMWNSEFQFGNAKCGSFSDVKAGIPSFILKNDFNSAFDIPHFAFQYHFFLELFSLAVLPELANIAVNSFDSL